MATTQQPAGRGAPPFGTALKEWRAVRRMSQLDLALTAGVSPRHVAFLETGRASPSREMVVALASALDVPLRARNTLLAAAGYASLYTERRLDDETLAPIRSALDLMLSRHEPFPGILLDRHWNLVDANATARWLFAPLLDGATTNNIVELLVANPRTRDVVVDWPVVAAEFLDRLKLEAAHGGPDPVLARLIDRLMPIAAAHSPRRPLPANRPFMSVGIETPIGRIELFSSIAEFGTVEDITVRDLRLELFFPADGTSSRTLHRRAG